jgi:hypothetical protein
VLCEKLVRSMITKFPSVRHVAVCLRLYGRPLWDTVDSMEVNPVESAHSIALIVISNDRFRR